VRKNIRSEISYRSEISLDTGHQALKGSRAFSAKIWCFIANGIA